jgi:hypothetical protein
MKTEKLDAIAPMSTVCGLKNGLRTYFSPEDNGDGV